MKIQFTQSELDHMLLEALIAEDRDRREAFEAAAADCGLVFNANTGLWADEKGSAL